LLTGEYFLINRLNELAPISPRDQKPVDFLNFEELQNRLIIRMRTLVQNGAFTERGLARTVGISQVHIHNVLKGARTLSINLNDLILKRLGLTIFDVCTRSELQDYVAGASLSATPSFDLPFLLGHIGPGIRWSTQVDWQHRHPVPCFLAGIGHNLVLARLVEDPEMDLSLGGKNIAVLDFSPGPPSPDALFVVDRGRDAVIRRIRPGSRKLYLAADADLDRPEKWEPLPAPSLDTLRGRVCWLGQDRALNHAAAI
jgi:hypothetical protein